MSWQARHAQEHWLERWWMLLAFVLICIAALLSTRGSPVDDLPACGEPIVAAPCRIDGEFGRMVVYRDGGGVTRSIPADQWSKDDPLYDAEPLCPGGAGAYYC
jgi:hypothetical protein